MKKAFVLDTNVILHDNACIYQFGRNDVVIPISVLEELDGFKKGRGSLNFHARKFLRALDEMSQDKIFNGGVSIGEGLGKLSIRLESRFHEHIELNFSPAKADHHVLNTAYSLSTERKGTQVTLVSKDVNLRMKAKSIGLTAQDYIKDHVKDIAALYRGLRTVENVHPEVINTLYKSPFEIPSDAVEAGENLVDNEYLILTGGNHSVLARFDAGVKVIRRVEKVPAYSILPRNAAQTFAVNALLDDRVKLVSITGKAGTGKTLLALAASLECKRSYRQIFIARPIVPLSNKDTGFLPGDIDSKLQPYMQPLHDNLGVIKNQFEESSGRHKKIEELLAEGKLKIEPLSYIRGRSLVKIYFIVDEAQNLTPHEIKTIITRAGENTKIVFTGDVFQIDHPYLDSHSNGLSYLIEKMKGQRLYAHINLERGERSELAEVASNLL